MVAEEWAGIGVYTKQMLDYSKIGSSLTQERDEEIRSGAILVEGRTDGVVLGGREWKRREGTNGQQQPLPHLVGTTLKSLDLGST